MIDVKEPQSEEDGKTQDDVVLDVLEFDLLVVLELVGWELSDFFVVCDEDRPLDEEDIGGPDEEDFGGAEEDVGGAEDEPFWDDDELGGDDEDWVAVATLDLSVSACDKLENSDITSCKCHCRPLWPKRRRHRRS